MDHIAQSMDRIGKKQRLFHCVIVTCSAFLFCKKIIVIA